MNREQGDKLYINDVTVLTPVSNSGLCRMEHQHVAVFDGHFLYVGNSEKDCLRLLDQASPGPYRKLDGKRRWLLPGFANTHSHMGMSLFRNASDDLALHDWLNDVIFPREARLTARDVYYGNLLSSLEMIRSGSTLAADMYFFPDACLDAAKESGLRLMLGVDPMVRAEMNDSGHHETGYHIRPSLIEEALRRQSSDPDLALVQINLEVHSIYLYPEALYEHYRQIADEHRLLVQIHLAETSREEEDSLRRYARRPVELAEYLGLLDGPVIAAHGVHLNDTDRDIYRRRGVVLSHNPASNMKLASGIADIPSALSAGVKISLGTDGPASNNSLDMYKEMYLASLLAKVRSNDPTSLPAWRTFQMATADGYDAFGISGGRIETGLPADFQLLDSDDERFISDQEAASVLVYTLPKDQVRTVCVAGKLLFHEGVFSSLDEERIRFEARRIADRLNLVSQ